MDDPLYNWRSDEHIIFGKYEMGRLLGQGTFAKVYYARDLVTLKSVALKVIKIEQVKKQGLMEQITHEIAAMQLVRHPNVVQLKEVMVTKTKIFLVMEYVRGGELFDKVVKGRLNEDLARKYFQQLISAVDYCHSRGVSHRDLKPENLLLDENEDLKVSDFGLSALPEQLRNDGMLHTQCGTPAYVAPEVLRKKGYDGAKTDVWSCGVILYVLLAGFLPFREENVMNMYKKIFKAEYQFPRWFSTDARRLIMKLLVVDQSNCHSRGVSHRDLKPENLLLDENEDLKVSDFGLSALPEQLRNDGMLHTQCGTPAYVAPEVLRRKGYDGAKTDIWSCGVILYVLLAGFLPFREENVMHMYKKIFKAEYQFPRWFSTDARRLIMKLLVVDQSRRITIPMIMRTPWFLKGLKTCDGVKAGLTGYTSPILLKTPSPNEEIQKDDKVCEEENAIRRSKSSPSSYNAFAFISSMCSSFDLSGMFETNLKLKSVFTSKFSASTIVNKLQTVAKKVNFKISYTNKNDYKLKMKGISEGRKGKVSVVAEVFEVAPEVAVVEFSKESGDSLEYEKFEEDIRPGLQDIVWSWQGETSNS